MNTLQHIENMYIAEPYPAPQEPKNGSPRCRLRYLSLDSRYPPPRQLIGCVSSSGVLVTCKSSRCTWNNQTIDHDKNKLQINQFHSCCSLLTLTCWYQSKIGPHVWPHSATPNSHHYSCTSLLISRRLLPAQHSQHQSYYLLSLRFPARRL
jgi:hypothetical protein